MSARVDSVKAVALNRLTRVRRFAFIAAIFLVAAMIPMALDSPVRAEPGEGTTAATRDLQRRITVGGLHTCAVLDTGEIQCWGANANGQLGNNTTVSTTVPKKVQGITTALGVSGGSAHTCALIHDGTVRCWGNNGSGQLGNGSTSPPDPAALTPVTVQGLTGVTALAAGGFHTCALMTGGGVKCWGDDGSGQLGDGGAVDKSPVPVDVTGVTGAIAIAAGEYHSCAAIATGAVKCWGHNAFGQLGDGTTSTSASPVNVSNLPDDDIHLHDPHKALGISAGEAHTCAVVDDGTARCWGQAVFGQLGNGVSGPGTQNTTPVRVKFDNDPGPLVDLQDLGNVEAITTGQFHSCARLSDDTARCWGQNGRGQLGDGTQTNRSSAVVLSSLSGVDAITAGGFHTCALVSTSMKCWGYNFYGQLGSKVSSSQVPVTVTALSGATVVTTGDGHACAVVTGSGAPPPNRPDCWGNNANGELGAGLNPATVPNTTIPVAVTGIPDADLITAGNGHVCALGDGSGTPKCWGRNTDGQLGNGSNSNSNVPVTTSGVTSASNLSTGGALGSAERGHSCAVLGDGTARCWGRNADGQLGNGTNTDSSTAVTVKFDNDPDPAVVNLVPLSGLTQVSAGGFHSCARKADATVWCWGFNGNGQLGNNSTSSKNYAVQVIVVDDPDPGDPDTPLTNAVEVAAGLGHSCARLGDGTVKCWGRNTDGEVGDGSNLQRLMPVTTSNITAPFVALAVTAGDNHTCGRVRNTGSNNTFAACWGSDSAGQLGNGALGNSNTPVAPVGLGEPGGSVSNVDLVTSISAARSNTCASLIDTTVSCWGDNTNGQLGDGVGPTRTTPIDVLNLGSVGGNSIPAPQDDAASTAPAVPVIITVLANDSDPDPGDALDVTVISDAPSKGTAVVNADNSITYTPDPDFCDQLTDFTDSFDYDVTDGVATVPATVVITVTCPNTPPVANDDNVNVTEDTPKNFNVLANDSDPNGNPMSVTTNTEPPNGTVAVAANGDADYTPNLNFCGADSFQYSISDGLGGVDSATVNIIVTCVNDPPDAVDDLVSTPEDTPVDINVGANDADPDGPSIAITSVGLPSNGAASATGPTTIRYTPNADFCGSDSFTYTVSDGSLTDTATVSVNVTPCTNDGPNANDDAGTTSEDTPVVIDVLANDTDPEGDALTVTAVTDPPHGTAAINGGGTSVTYTPDPDFCGVDSFSYTAADGSGDSDTAQVIPVDVICTNDPPVANDDLASTGEDSSVGISVLANDTDPDAGDTLSVTSVSDPPDGTAEIGSSGVVTYSPNPNFCGTDTFNYTISDGNGSSDVGAVSITVSCVNDAPAMADISDQTTPWGEDLTIPLSAVDPDAGDPDPATSDTVAYSIVSGASGAAIVDDGLGNFTFVWTPSSAQVGVHNVTIRGSDGTLHDDETFSVTVEKRVTFISYTGAPAGQYSDPVAVSAVLTDFEGNPLSGKSLSFNIGTQSTSATTDGAGSGSGSIVLVDPPASTSVNIEFAADSAYSGTATINPFTIEKEAVKVTFNGQRLTIASGSSAPVNLSASIEEESDGHYGSSLATHQVSFTEGGGGTLCTSSVTLTGPGKGSASCATASLSLGSRAVIAKVTGAAYGGPVDVSVFVVAQLPSGSAAGGGRILTDPSDVMSTDDFGFRAVPVRRSPPSGDAVHVFRGIADLGAGSKPYAFVVKSSFLTALSRSCTGGKDKVCSAAVEANDATKLAVDLATGSVISLTGLSQINLDATDAAEPSGGSVPPDTYAVSISGGTTYLLGTPASQLLISGGNIRVPS